MAVKETHQVIITRFSALLQIDEKLKNGSTKTWNKNENIKQKQKDNFLTLIDGNGAVVKMSVITLKRISRALYLSLLRQTFSQSQRQIKPRN